MRNIDKEGSSLDTFLAKVVARAFRDECVLIGCHIERSEDSSSPDQRRPYFSCIDIPKSVFAPRVELIDGVNQLTRISIKSTESVAVEDSFEIQLREVYWVYRLTQTEPGQRIATVQRYIRERLDQKQRQDKTNDIVPDGEERPLTNARNELLAILPFIWLGIDPNSKVGSPQIPAVLCLGREADPAVQYGIGVGLFAEAG